MKIVLAAINAKYIHANLAVCSLRAFSDEYKEQIQIKEYTINQYTEDILADLYKEKADMVAFYLLYMEYGNGGGTDGTFASDKAGYADLVRWSGGIL